MPADPHSFADPSKARVTHLQWTASVNMDEKIIRAIATWTIEVSDGADTIVLDTKDLNIEKIVCDDDSQPAAYRLGEQDNIMGQVLMIPLKPATHRISVYYSTHPDAEALQWLLPNKQLAKNILFSTPSRRRSLPEAGYLARIRPAYGSRTKPMSLFHRTCCR